MRTIENLIKSVLAENLLIAKKHEDKEEEQRRLDICRGNKEKQIKSCRYYDIINDKCNDCGCIIAKKAQALTNRTLSGGVEITHCPKGFWGIQDIEKES